MTEQPVETEQQFLGNTAPPATMTELPVTPALAAARQQYVPGAHLLRGPLWSPVDDVEVTVLIRKSINANKLLAIAKSKASAAEDALSLALGVETEALEAVEAADQALLAFTRKDTGL